MTDAEKNEIRHQMAYAEKQFLIYQAYVNLNIAKGNHNVASRYIVHMTDCNDFIDKSRRQLEPGTRE
jgi:hypothetical protein